MSQTESAISLQMQTPAGGPPQHSVEGPNGGREIQIPSAAKPSSALCKYFNTLKVNIADPVDACSHLYTHLSCSQLFKVCVYVSSPVMTRVHSSYPYATVMMAETVTIS